ncbi:Uncharacterized protein Adt_21197 [Abeliophyllum distichum]|uniref:Uncharacterized protein n=1 Tax=Abeliophyllum distichum TaxID=126358 RepID=A0ABD1SYM8_9LAMI
MSHLVNAMHMKKSTCEEYEANYSTSECAILSQQSKQVEYVQSGQCQRNNLFSNTFNPGLRNQLNFSWRDNQNNSRPQDSQFQQPEKKVTLKDMFGMFMEKIEQYMEANNHFMRKTETTLQN